MKGAAVMSDRKNNFEKFSANQPKRTFTGPVMDERGNKDLPPGKKGGGYIIISSATQKMLTSYRYSCKM